MRCARSEELLRPPRRRVLVELSLRKNLSTRLPALLELVRGGRHLRRLLVRRWKVPVRGLVVAEWRRRGWGRWPRRWQRQRPVVEGKLL